MSHFQTAIDLNFDVVNFLKSTLKKKSKHFVVNKYPINESYGETAAKV